MATQQSTRPANRPGSSKNLGRTVRTSSELAAEFIAQGGSAEAARKHVSRLAKEEGVWRSDKFRLSQNERLFSSRDFVGSSQFLKQVALKLEKSNRQGIYRCVQALCERTALHRLDLLRLLAVPVGQSSTNGRRIQTYSDEIAALEELGARLINRGSSLECLVSPGQADLEQDDVLNLFQRARYQVLLARILGERLRRQNMMSWNKLELPASEPFVVFNGQAFSAYGFSYLKPVVRWSEGSSAPKPCPVLIDCYDGLCTQVQVESFLRRVERATCRGKSRLASLGVIAAKDFTTDAWKLARREALFTVSFRQIFGDEALDAMVEIERLVGGFKSLAPDEAQTKFEEIVTDFDELKCNPVVADLRAIGLEALCGLILQQQGYVSPELGLIVDWRETTRDIDVYAIKGDDELRIVECKAYHRRKSITEIDVTKFFTSTVPALKKWLRENHRPFKTCVAEIWTTGPKGKIAETALRGLSSPSTDTWRLRRLSDMHDEIPARIRERSVKLLSAIALTPELTSDPEIDGEEPVEVQDS